MYKPVNLILVIFSIIVAILAISVPTKYYAGASSVSNKSQDLYTVPSGNPDLTAGWKTYTDYKYGFAVKYPANLEVFNSDDYYHYVEFHVNLPDSASKPLPPFYISVIADSFIAKNPSAYNYMTSDWINDFLNMKVGDIKKDAGTNFEKLPDVKIDGEEATVVHIKAIGTDQKRFYIKKKGFIYIIAYYNQSEEFTTFLASFKFIK